MESFSLVNWADHQGFITLWHLFGPYDAGLEKNMEPDLFQKKISSKWVNEYFSPYFCDKGASIEGMFPNIDGVNWNGFLAEPKFYPELKLSLLKEYYPFWEEKLAEVDTNKWDQLYFACAVIDVAEQMEINLRFGAWDGCRLWVDGQLLFEEHSYHKSVYDLECVKLTLAKGYHQIIFQVDRDGLVARLDGTESQLSSIKQIKMGESVAERKVSTFYQIHQMAHGIPLSNAYDAEKYESFQQWQEEMRFHYHQCLGQEVPAIGEVSYQKCSEEVKPHYTQTRYEITAPYGSVIPAYVLVPPPEKRNGRSLLLCHGHANRFTHLIGMNVPPSKIKMWMGEYINDYGRRLAEKGFVITIFCLRAFSERKDLYRPVDQCNLAQQLLGTLGYQLPRQHIHDVHLMYDFLKTIPEVDVNRLGISGLSGGGTLSYLAGAFDERFKAVASFCCICSYRDYAFSEGCGMQIVNGWFPKGDMPELLSLIAPRPLLIGQGKYDNTFNALRVKELAQKTQSNYQAAGVAENCRLEIYPLAHEYESNIAADFFMKSL